MSSQAIGKMTELAYRGPEILEFKMKEPLPSGLVCSINDMYIVQIYNSQIDIDKKFTVRGIVIEHLTQGTTSKSKTMNLEAVKKELGNLGLSKAHVDIILDTVKAVPYAPQMFQNLSSLVLQKAELEIYKGNVSSALKSLGVAQPEKPKAPAAKKEAAKKPAKPAGEKPAPPMTAAPGGGEKKAPEDAPDDDLAKARNVAASMGAGNLPDKLDM